MPLKRDNWTNEEVIKLIEGQALVPMESGLDNFTQAYNNGIMAASALFKEHFITPPDSFGALSYDTDTGELFHTGKIPDEV